MSSDMPTSFSDLIIPAAKSLVESTGVEFVRQIGIESTREVVFDVLCGRNLRDSTEMVTRRRLALLNGAFFAMMLQGETRWPGFIEKMPAFAALRLEKGGLDKTEKWLTQWAMGLTNKAVQNVLRDEADAIERYRQDYVRACLDAVENLSKTHGELSGEAVLRGDIHVELSWQLMVYLMSAIGSQTLTIRGSAKSTFGKLFERLVLGSMLSILGFQMVPPKSPANDKHVFWLSDRGEERESDATLLFELGKGVRFDIGFIGRGNPEITLDKVSRFERNVELANSHWYMSTIIIVDQIAKGSRLRQRASKLGGVVIQMSGSYWPQQVARELKEALGFEHPLVDMPVDKIADYIRSELHEVDLEDFVPGL